MTSARMRLLRDRVGAARRHADGGAVSRAGGTGGVGDPAAAGRQTAGGNRTAGGDVESGFVLLEEIVSISILIIVMAALATFFLGATQSTSYQRAKQSAIQLSNTEMDSVRAANAALVVSGRTQSLSDAQQNAPAAMPVAVQTALASMTPAVDTSKTVVPQTVATVTSATANKISYTINDYLGTCFLATDPTTHQSTCTKTNTGAPGTSYLRAVVATTWTGVHCPNSLCSYVTSSLISQAADPQFSLNAAGPPTPTVASPGDQVSTVGSGLPQPGANGLQLTVTDPNSVAPFTWTTTALPAGLSMDTTGLITGTPTAVTSKTAITVVATDAFGRQSPALAYNWTVYAAPTVTGLTDPFATSPGATITAQTLPYTCPTSSCTVAVTGAPGGIGLAATSTGTAAASIPITAASGSVFLVGTVGTSATGPYQVSVTITDTASTVSGIPSKASWTVASPAVTGLGARLTTTVGATPAAQTLGYSCPTTSCSYTLAGAPAGIGLSATSAGTASTSPITVSNASGNLYLVGTVGTGVTPGSFTLTITPTDTGSNVNGTVATSTWTVLAAPTVTGLTAISTTPGATVANQTLNYTCPSSSCTFTLAGAPGGIGLTTGVATTPAASVSVTAASGKILVAGTVSTSASGPYTLVVSSLDTAYTAAGSSTSATWTVQTPTVTGLTDPFSTTAGATIAAQKLSYTCPTSNCAYNLTGAPTGVGLATSPTATETPPTSLSVKNASGVLYLVGTVPGAATASYSLVLTPVDTNSGASAATDTAAWTVYPVPTVTGLAAFKTTVGAAITAQALKVTCPSGACTYAVSNGPAGVGLSLTQNGTAGPSVQTTGATTIYLVGSPTAAGSGTLSVTPVDTASQAAGTANTAAWTVYAAPTVTGSTAAFRTPAGRAITGQALTYTCPTSTCTYTVTGAPTGIGLATSATATGTPPTALSVTTATGTLYLVGSPSPAGSYSVVVTAKDTTYGVTGGSVTAAWTVTAAPTISALTTPFKTTVGATITAQQLTFTCPTSTCTFTLAGAPTGIGLAATTGGTGTTALKVTTASGSIYVVGSPSPAGSYPSVTVTPLDTTDNVTGAVTTAAWTVYVPPTVSGLANPFSTSVGATIASQKLPFTCPSGSCTEALTGAPGGVGLDTDDTGAVNPSVPVTGTTGNVYLRGTVAGPVSGPSSYVNDVKSQGATNFWRLDEANGATTGADSIGTLPLTEQSGVANGATGATLSASGGTSTYDGAATFNGVSTTGSAGTRTAIAAPTVFSESIWFKTTTTAGGKLIGFGGSATGNSNQYDRQIYMTNSGQLVFGVYNGGYQVTGTSAGAYNDGAWHEAVAMISGAGMVLYVDGTSVGTNTNTTPEGNGSGYWRIGGDNLRGWPSAPTSNYFTGTLDDAAIYSGVVLTQAQVQKQYVDAQGVLYTATVTPTDTPSGVSGVPNTATWTVFAGPTAAGLPATFTVNAGATVANQPITYTCPTTTCTYALAGQPSGIGLSAAATGATSTTPVTVTNSSGTLYLRGTVAAGAGGTYTVSVTPTETASGAVGNATTSAWTVNYPPPVVTDSVSTFTVTAGAAVANQSLSYTCPSANCTYTLTGYPAGIGLSAATTGTPTATLTLLTASGTFYLRGTVGSGAAGSYPNVAVTPVDNLSNQTGTAATASWTVNPPPSVTNTTTPFRTTVGAVVANQSLPYSCPSTTCTYTLTGAPTGIGLSTSTTGTVSNQVTVPTTATSGTIYLRGTVGTSVSPGPFNLVITPTDTGSGVTGPTSTAAWTVYAQPTVTGLPANFGTLTFNQAVSINLTYSCPTANCTFTLSGAPSGVGLSATSTGGTLSNTVTVANTGTTLYLRGTATPRGNYTVVVTPTDNVSGTNGPTNSSTGSVQ